MKISKIIATAFIAVVALTGCKKDGATGPAGAAGPAGPSLSGTLEGYVDLYDEYGDLISNATGVYITIPGKTGTDSTNSAGIFTKNLSTGTYELDFAKSGYGSMKIPSLNFVGGGTQYINAHVQLTQLPTFTLSGFSVGTSTVATNPAVTVTITPGSANAKGRRVIVFFGSTASVSNTPGNYLGYQVINLPATSTSVTSNIGASTTLYGAGATSGNTIYLIAYPIADNSNASTYSDVATGKTVFNNVLTTSPVATQSVVVP